MNAASVGVVSVAGVSLVFLMVVLLVCALIAAILSGRIAAVLAGLGGILLLGGVFVLVGLYFVRIERAGPAAPWTQVGPPRTVQFVPAARPSETIDDPGLNQIPLADFPDALRNDKSAALSDTGATPSSNAEPGGKSRPAWMDTAHGRVGDVYRTTVTAGPWLTRAECEEQLAGVLREAVQRYADRFLGEGKGRFVDLDMSYIHDHIVRDEWEERRQQTIETMTYLHELLEFDQAANRAIDASYKQTVVKGRLGYTAIGGGVLLGLLTVVFGYLKVDTLTRGYYTGRLRLTAATAILALVAVAGLLVS
ncbi:MAG TPA: hypothetical protein VHC22_25690 [Pirellulales bacterium]|nr:hypothetical protein [Pirellulales bacterium]